MFFQPKFMPNIGWLQDAGIVENNPLSCLLSQYYRLYPGRGHYQYLINIGSGQQAKSSTTNPRGLLSGVMGAYRTSAFARIVSAYEWLLNGLSYWESYTGSMKQSSELRERCVRLDTPILQARLDDATAVPELKATVHSDMLLSKTIDDLADRIVASLFYFELESIPDHSYGNVEVKGRILCLRRSGDAALPLVVEKLRNHQVRFSINNKVLGSDLLKWALDEKGDFSVPTENLVTGQELSVSLRWPDGRCYPVSGSPFLVPNLVVLQGLDAPFGLPDHRRWRHKPAKQIGTLSPQGDSLNQAGKPNLKRGLMEVDMACKKRRIIGITNHTRKRVQKRPQTKDRTRMNSPFK